MRTPLRSLVLTAAILAATALTTGSALAQKRFDVPFSFNAGNRVYPAGVYVASPGGTITSVVLKSLDTPQSFSWLVGPGDPLPTDTRAILTFDQIGGRYALRTIQYGNQITPVLDAKFRHRELEHAKMAQLAPARTIVGQ